MNVHSVFDRFSKCQVCRTSIGKNKKLQRPKKANMRQLVNW